MENLGFLLVALICPISMGLMMLFMVKGKKNRGDSRRDEQPEASYADAPAGAGRSRGRGGSAVSAQDWEPDRPRPAEVTASEAQGARALGEVPPQELQVGIAQAIEGSS